MDDFNYLEEPPLIPRVVKQAEPSGKPGLSSPKSDRWSAPSGGDSGATAGPRSRMGLLLGLVALVVLGLQGWRLHSVRRDLADLRTVLEQTHGSLGLVWESTKGFDQDYMARLARLADSIRSVSAYAQGEVRLWTQRQDSAINVRLDDFARADQLDRSRMDALERQNRTYSSAFEALARRASTQESNTRDVSATVGYVRAMLSKLSSELTTLEQRDAASTSAYGQLTRRVENLSVWADGFRQAGLSGEAVQGRLSSFADELRRMRIRVDSLRPMSRAVTSSDTR